MFVELCLASSVRRVVNVLQRCAGRILKFLLRGISLVIETKFIIKSSLLLPWDRKVFSARTINEIPYLRDSFLKLQPSSLQNRCYLPPFCLFSIASVPIHLLSFTNFPFGFCRVYKTFSFFIKNFICLICPP